MHLLTSWIDVLARAFDFQGRSGRIEVWSFHMLLWLVNVPAIWLASTYQLNDGYFYGLWLALGIPGLALSVRRLHDMDLVGWWVGIAFVPYLNWGFIVVLLVVDGSEDDNRFGPRLEFKTDNVSESDLQKSWTIHEIRELSAFNEEKVRQQFERAFSEKNYDGIRSILVGVGLSPSEAYEFVMELRK